MSPKYPPPRIVFLVAPEVATFVRLMARATAQPVTEVLRLAIRHGLALERPPQGLDLQRGQRTERTEVYLPATLKALVQERARRDNMTAGSWLAAAVSDYAATWVRENRDLLVPEMQRQGLLGVLGFSQLGAEA